MDEEAYARKLLNTERLDKIAAILLLGLTTDGAHHKQWSLEEALRLLAGESFVNGAREEFCFEQGIAP